MMFPAKLPKMLTMTAVVITGRGERYEKDLFITFAYAGIYRIFPYLGRSGYYDLCRWADRYSASYPERSMIELRTT